MRSLLLVAATATVTLCAAAAAQAGCFAPASVAHTDFVSTKGTGFDLSGTGYAKGAQPGPAPRFWAWGHYAQANHGTRSAHVEGLEWMISPATTFKLEQVPASRWIVYQMNWSGQGVKGCIGEVDTNRTVVELSFADPAREGKTDHRGYYLAVSVDSPSNALYDLDRVRNAEGTGLIAVQPIPTPAITSVSEGKGVTKVKAKLVSPVSFSEAGADKPVRLVAGLRLYYAQGSEPTSSAPDGYKPVMKADGKGELGLVTTETAEFSVPSGKPAWIVARVQYADSTSEILSNAVSAHVAVDGKSSGRGRSRGRRP